MAVAAIWGTTVAFTEYYNTVTIETIDGRVAVITKGTFDYLYLKLNDFVAALKEDCIYYVVNERDKCLFQYPEWFIDAVFDGYIFEDDNGILFFYDDDGELVVSPNSMILRNYKGELKHLEAFKFHQYYDTLRE